MQQTPVHEYANGDLLRLIPPTAQRIIEIGCSSGAIAREFKKVNPNCHYHGIDVVDDYVDLAKRYCDEVGVMDIESASDDFYAAQADCDCWLFGDVLEHLKDPWTVLKKVRRVMPAHGQVLACIPNVQHWSMTALVAVGEFRYVDSGLMDKTHLRWFSRKTMLTLFESSGLRIVEMYPRFAPVIPNKKLEQIIADLATLQGADPQQAIKDSQALQYVIKAIPA